MAFVGQAVAQRKPAKTAAKPAPTVQELILQGKVADAVRVASRSPDAARASIKDLMTMADSQITDRKIAEAQSTLEATARFADAYAKVNKNQELPVDSLRGRLLRVQGIQFSDQKQYEKAEATLRQALELSKRAADGTLEAGIHNNLGYALRFQEKPGGEDRLEEAAREFDTAQKMAGEQKDMLRAGSYNFNLGEVLLQLGRLDPALQAFKRSEAQNRVSSRGNLEARAILMQGVVVTRINPVSKDPMNSEPIRLFQLAERMFEKLGDNRNAGWSYYLMGDYLAYSQQSREAIALAERGVPFLTSAGDKTGLAKVYDFVGDMWGRLGDKEKAEKYKNLAAENRK